MVCFFEPAANSSSRFSFTPQLSAAAFEICFESGRGGRIGDAMSAKDSRVIDVSIVNRLGASEKIIRFYSAYRMILRVRFQRVLVKKFRITSPNCFKRSATLV